jgi:hypothetical protein
MAAEGLCQHDSVVRKRFSARRQQYMDFRGIHSGLNMMNAGTTIAESILTTVVIGKIQY